MGELEYPHCTQLTSKDLRSNLHAHVQCGFGLRFRSESLVLWRQETRTGQEAKHRLDVLNIDIHKVSELFLLPVGFRDVDLPYIFAAGV